MKTVTFLCLYCLLVFCDVKVVRSRSAALSEICSRNSRLAFCKSSTQVVQPQPDATAARPADSNYPAPPELPVLSSASSCDQFSKMGLAQCQNGSVDNVFCNSYRQLCMNATAPIAADANQGVLDCQKENLHYFFECTRQSLKLKQDMIFCQNYQAKCMSSQPRLQDALQQQQASNDVSKMMFMREHGENQPENSETLDELCQKHKNLGDKFCTGFEVDEVRKECNYYRVYCLHKKPIPIPDGSIGIGTDLWNIGGIPYYPFDPRGQIGGGENKDIKFGDWGAKVDTKSGVSGFYTQNEHSEADWMDGSFDDRSVDWSVPVVGIHGYDHGLVKLNGIANPSDLPSVLAGGVPDLGPPLKDLGETIEEKRWTPPPFLS